MAALIVIGLTFSRSADVEAGKWKRSHENNEKYLCRNPYKMVGDYSLCTYWEGTMKLS